MIVPCDGCHRTCSHSLKTVNAKIWKPDVCDVSLDNSHDCSNSRCEFPIDGECCVEFQFCDDCLNNKAIVNKFFIEYTNIS